MARRKFKVTQGLARAALHLSEIDFKDADSGRRVGQHWWRNKEKEIQAVSRFVMSLYEQQQKWPHELREEAKKAASCSAARGRK